MKYIVVILFAMISINTLQAQEDIEIIEITEDAVLKDIPFTVIEKAPIYPGCTGQDNSALKNCFSNAISNFITKNLKFSSTENYGDVTFKMLVCFVIDKKGQITDINVRAPSKSLEKEVIRTVEKLPQMIPGKQKDKNVNVRYTLPIIFDVE